MNILLLEDDETYAQVLERAMKKRGHTLYWVSDAQMLNQQLEIAEEMALVLMDLKLTEGTSLGLIEQVRARYESARIIIVTGYASIATTVEAIKRGADNYLPKPVTADEILNAYAEDSDKSEQMEQIETLSPRRLEWEHIQRVLQAHEGNISRTAKALNMHRRTLQRKLQKKPCQH